MTEAEDYDRRADKPWTRLTPRDKVGRSLTLPATVVCLALRMRLKTANSWQSATSICQVSNKQLPVSARARAVIPAVNNSVTDIQYLSSWERMLLWILGLH